MAAELTSLNGGHLNSLVRKRSFNIKTTRRDGLLIQIHNTILDHHGKKKCYRFANVTFNDTCEQMAASDQVGNIFVVDFISLKFWKLHNSGYCSALAYSAYKKNELFIGRDDGIVQMLNTDTSVVTGTLVGHTVMVNWISFATEYMYCLTATINEALIWNLEKNSKIHQLTLHITIKLKKVRFIPTSNDIFASYEDDTIQVWKFDSFQSVLQISPEKWENHQLNSFAFSRNGQALVVGGQMSKLFFISLKSWNVKRVFSLPETNGGIKQLEFLSQPYDGGKSKILLVLTNSFNVHFLNVMNNNILLTVELADVCLSKMICSDDGKYTVFVLDTGELNIYSSEHLFPCISSIIESDGKQKFKNGRYKKKNLEDNTKGYSDLKLSVNFGKKYKKSVEPLKNCRKSILQNELKNKIGSTLRIDRLRLILKEFGEYPGNYRVLIWKNILQLPSNKSAFEALVEKELHVVSRMIADTYPLENKLLLSNLKRLVSCLSHWSPLFSQVSYLPLMVFPFIKVLKSDPLACFEVVATFIVNWCQRWFEFFPFPPVNILSLIENLLCEWDEELLRWFTDHQITSRVYAWPLLETVFSELLTSQEWLQLFDNILSNEPSFILFAVVSFNIMSRSALLSLIELKDFVLFYKTPTSVNIKKLVHMMYHMNTRTKKDNHPRIHLKSFTPLAAGDTYQVFQDYPKFVIDGQAEQVNEMRIEELELLKEQARLANARLEQEREYENIIRKQIQNSQLRDLESDYKDALIKEEERLAEHRHKVMNMKKELKQKEKQVLDETREIMLQQNAEKRKIELETMLKDIDRKRVRHEMDMKQAEEELKEQFESLMSQKKDLQFQLAVANDIKAYPPPQHESLREQQEQLASEIRKLREDITSLNCEKKQELSNRIAAAENFLQSTECRLAEEMAERQNTLLAGQKNLEVIQLQKETASLEKEVTSLLERLVEHKLLESREKERVLKDSMTDRKMLFNEQFNLAESLGDATLRHSNNYQNDNSSFSSYFTTRSSDNQEEEHNRITLGFSRCENIPEGKATFSHQLHENDFLGHSGDFYKREQQAIKLSMDLRQRLLLSKR